MPTLLQFDGDKLAWSVDSSGAMRLSVNVKPSHIGRIKGSYDELKDLSLTVTIDKEKKKRSLDANAYFHLLINQLASYYKISNEEMKVKMVLEYGTIALNKDKTKFGIKVPKGSDIKQFYPYSQWFKETVENGITFDCYLLYKPTHTLDSAEMARLIDGVVNECKEVGIETRTPEELSLIKTRWKK